MRKPHLSTIIKPTTKEDVCRVNKISCLILMMILIKIIARHKPSFNSFRFMSTMEWLYWLALYWPNINKNVHFPWRAYIRMFKHEYIHARHRMKKGILIFIQLWCNFCNYVQLLYKFLTRISNFVILWYIVYIETINFLIYNSFWGFSNGISLYQ